MRPPTARRLVIVPALALALVSGTVSATGPTALRTAGSTVAGGTGTSYDAESILLQARTVATIVGRMDRPMHSGELDSAEGEGPDALFHRLEGAATDLEDTTRVLGAIGQPDEVRVLLVDELYPGVQSFAAQAYELRDLMAAQDADKPAVSSILAALDDLDLEVAGLQDSVAAAAASVQEEQLNPLGGLGGPLNPKLLPSGNVLVALSLEDRVVELSPAGDVVWQHPIGYPTDVERLEGGHTLISSRDESRVVEIDETGQEVWSFAGTSIYGVDQLPNGNRLVTEQGGDAPRVAEVDASGAVIWEYTGGPNRLVAPSAQRLANGNTLIADNSGYEQGRAVVTEVTSDGDAVWTYDEGLWGVYGVARLENGNTLINDQGNGRIIEVTPDGEIVWRFGGLDAPGGFGLASDGTMVVAVFGENRLFEIDRDVPGI